mmetsp:Transcript_12382/g.27472  ORF Transcript_12382/g.27472 Transcript_12382/m.27472 type:complete len:408 (-) Transcript_12382:40-1263(-)
MEADDADPFSCFGDGDGDSLVASDEREASETSGCEIPTATTTGSDHKTTDSALPLRGHLSSNQRRAERLVQESNARQANMSVTHVPLRSPTYEVYSRADDYGVKGQVGLRARRPFAVGDEIIREGPAMRVRCAHAASSREEAEEMLQCAIVETYDGLPVQTAQAVMDLSTQDKYCNESESDGGTDSSTDEDGGGRKTVYGIFQTNSFQLGDETDHAGLFLTIARMNHSCRPNATHFWRPDLHKMVIHATVDIGVGDEICTCYGPSDCRDTAGRRHYLQERYSFDCACGMCMEGNDAGGDDRIRELGILFEDIALRTSSTGQDAIQTLQIIDNCLELMEEQGLGGDSGQLAKPILRHGYQVAVASDLCSRDTCRSYLSRELRATTMCEGAESYRSTDIQSMLNNHYTS